MIVNANSQDVSTYFVLRKVTDNTELTGATITDIDLTYTRSGADHVLKVDATALATPDAEHSDNKAIEVDATDCPGLYRVDWPDAAFVAGVKQIILTVKYATAFTEHLLVELDSDGAGAIEWTYTLTSSVAPNPPIPDAHVWVTSDLLGTNIIASGTTDQYGEVTFNLDAGEIYVWRAKTGFTFVNPDVEGVSA